MHPAASDVGTRYGGQPDSMSTVTRRWRILIVWDDAAKAAEVASALVEAGSEARHAVDSLTGLMLVETWQPSLIILNWSQPLIGGPVFLYALQTGLDVPPRVIVLADEDRAPPVRWPAIAGTITKPFAVTELVQMVSTLSVDRPSTSVDCA